MTVSYTSDWFSSEGAPFPLGATWIPNENAYNFAIYSKHATSVTLLLYGRDNVAQPMLEVLMSHLTNKSGPIWHCRIPMEKLEAVCFYAYRVDGLKSSGQYELHAFDHEKILLDPYAKCVYFPEAYDRSAAMKTGPNDGLAPLGMLVDNEEEFDWGESRAPFHQHDLVIYEMHVRGFSKRDNSGVAEANRGTYRGAIEKLPYLKELGVTAVELLPVHQFDPQEGNYWGYMTMNFFAPHHGYSSDACGARREFREMVRAYHEAGIEVILDVVFNHTSEGDHRGPCYSFKGIDNSTYYMLSGDRSNPYKNYSGTGNTLHCANRNVGQMVLDSLRYWVTECHVDGFRFDLASVFSRRTDGSVKPGESRIVAAIRSDPVLSNVRLIAEPWDAAGLYQLGTAFPGKSWLQWNGRFRDDVRRFVKGDAGMVPDLMRRLYGSDDLFPDCVANACHPSQSVNYVNSHDGFTLYDQVSYNHRHNNINGHDNTDGHVENHSWNCGWEGDKNVPSDILALRKQQAKNFCCLIMLANGTPMFAAGDEFLHTQKGNNNPYNQDNETTWLDWSRLNSHKDIFRFFRLMIAFRKSHPTISRSRYWRGDVCWFGTGAIVGMSAGSRQLAYYLDGRSQNDNDLYVMINGDWRERPFEIQERGGEKWCRVVDTAKKSPADIVEPGKEVAIRGRTYKVRGRSVVVLMRASK